MLDETWKKRFAIEARPSRRQLRRMTLSIRPNGLQPTDVALKDNGEFRVESIMKHTGDPKRKKDMDFLFRWMGYDEPP